MSIEIGHLIVGLVCGSILGYLFCRMLNNVTYRENKKLQKLIDERDALLRQASTCIIEGIQLNKKSKHLVSALTKENIELKNGRGS
jgi:uncharacterized membrane-anchored protein YhcB (DUF1043 family)